MKVKVIKASDKSSDYWYNEAVGEVFHVAERSLSSYEIIGTQLWSKGTVDTGYWIDKEDCEIVEEPKLQESLVKMFERPTVGLRPKYIVDSQRTQEILEAMLRFSQTGKDIPKLWMDELAELNKRGDAK